jgi:hypothetical protein
MRAIAIVVLGMVLAACSPAQQQTTARSAQTPEAVVRAVYDAATQRNAHEQPTDINQLPLSDGLLALVRQASDAAEANEESFLDGDPVLDCQDCSPLSAITVTTISPPANGHATVEARFTVAGDARVETWEMVETPQSWRADNIRGADGYNLRTSAEQEIRNAARSCTETRGAAAAEQLAVQCTQISPASHPPCNPSNPCAMMESEIRRSCGLLDSAHRPAVCNEESDEAP